MPPVLVPLDYNPYWVDRNLTNRRSTEALLAPERDAGNVSPNDYEAAVEFSASPHRFYRLIGGLLALPLNLAFRKPSWSPMRTYVSLIACTIGGSIAGQTLNAFSHFNFVRSLENPSGFVQAIRNIQINSGKAVAPGPAITGSDSSWTVDTDAAPTEPSPLALPSTSDTKKPSISPPSKWDQIRAANTRPSTNSSWDALRQSHERTRVSSLSSDPESDPFQRSRDQDRAAEQAKFDDMLERERNFKDNS